MEQKLKRLGYKDKEKQNEAVRKYRATETGKIKVKYNRYKSCTRTFIKELATEEDLIMISNLLEEKKKKF
ncbi:hypothetical protein [Pseudostreptobacillus hongkongensis]|uniref:hypothetical protein n=1 Tax=Pseudostreptobacillus hongkongensis TaxID=1162717 RepID=UPI00082B9379|nr:hypothetical protein [Pseudostreptobacillus hongkongensis]